jgi:2-(1,2-epoxy-1,2-dihydrophenyl)acetyl-CoA isomerase
MPATTVLTTIDNGVATLTLNRPEQGNGINMALAEDLLAAALAVSADPAARCVVLTGAGRMFCVGGDIAEFAAAGRRRGTSSSPRGQASRGGALLAEIGEKPLVCVVNGPAAGAGLGLAAAGDIGELRGTLPAAYPQLASRPMAG